MKLLFHYCLGVLFSLCILNCPYASAADWQQSLEEIKKIHEKLGTAGGIDERLYGPAMREAEFRTMDDSKYFHASFVCGSKQPVVKVSSEPGSNGELNITVSYDTSRTGVLSKTLRVNSVAGACSAGAVYECSPSGSWSKCKYGLFEFNGSSLEIHPNLPGGSPRPALGMSGCFCFSSHCGNTSEKYMYDILYHIGAPLAQQIAGMHQNLLVSTPEFDERGRTMTWYSGDAGDCSSASVSSLTKQSNQLELDYKGVIANQGDDSPWKLLTENLERKTSELTCTQQTKASSAWGAVKKIQPTDFWIGWDTNGGSKQCFYMTAKRACGSHFGEPDSWGECLSQARRHFAGICHNLWVASGTLINILDVQNAKANGPRLKMGDIGAACYGAESGSDDVQLWYMDCVGERMADRFICYSASKTPDGKIILNDDPSKYDGCHEIRPFEDNCKALADNEKCRLVKEVTDGVITISNGTLTSARPRQSCRTISGAKESITFCEPWKRRVRTYECSDIDDKFSEAKKRTDYVGGHIELNNNKYMAAAGDLTFGEDGSEKHTRIDAELQFDKKAACIPSCVVEQKVANYEMIIPSQQGKLEADGSWHVPDAEYSVIPQGTRTVIDTVECSLEENRYECPVPEGWKLRSQCSCADGNEFINTIAALSVINEISKDFICSTGQEQGVCGPDAGDETLHPVVCGDFPQINEEAQTGGELAPGINYWECSPKLWTGITVADQQHQVTVNAQYECLGGDSRVQPDGLLDLGPLVPRDAWFEPKMAWAKSAILDHLGTLEIQQISQNICNCPGEEYSIDICAARAGGSYLCLTDSLLHSSYDACKVSCIGKATFNTSQGLCTWSSPDLAYGNVNLSMEYLLRLQPEQEKVFGEVLFSGSLRSTVNRVENHTECQDKSVIDEAEYHTVSESCLQKQGERSASSYRGFFTNNSAIISYDKIPEPVASHIGYDRLVWVNSFEDIRLSDSKTGQQVSARYSNSFLDGKYVTPNSAPLNNCSGVISFQAVSGAVATCTFHFPEVGITLWFTHRQYSTKHDFWHNIHEWNSYIDWKAKVNYFECPQDGTRYASEVACENACTTQELRCKNSGQVVQNSDQCSTIKYRCTGDGIQYASKNACEQNCLPNQLTYIPCTNVDISEARYSYYLAEASESAFGLKAAVSYVDQDGNETLFSETPYSSEAIILNQCLERYTQPYIKFDEPGTNAHFEFSHADHAIYEMAFLSNQLPHEAGQLPALPAVYRGYAQRQQSINQMNLWDDEVDEGTGQVTQVPNTDLSPEELEALEQNQDATLDQDGNWGNNIAQQSMMVPRAPMFMAKKLLSLSEINREGRLGRRLLTATNLVPSVYYYECPYGTTNKTEQCGQKAPFGGVAQTIAGPRCFQYFCDDQAMIEPTAEQYSGCGLANDGQIK